MKKPESHYNKEGVQHLIEINLQSISQLFNTLDPAPFREKDLEVSAEKYIVDSVQDLHFDSPVSIIFYLPQAVCSDEASRSISEAIHNHFTYRHDVTSKELRFTLHQGRIALLIGLVFLFMCITAQHMIASMGKTDLLWSIIEEGFLISGWVAMWRPIDVFLYQWWPIRRRRRIFSKLMKVPVELRAIDA